MARHCPVTGQPVITCDCGACDEDSLEPGDGNEEREVLN